eukprot:TRINITY_DN48064_c0_g1_i1.p1 TRINITY_DN48064_c0_g1~~TRINITY_DN48064_c0_g1_i1.p1  ORF type:complete len:440 (-),score=231.69 TRINITY_DN48064_c0_g1_i1:210-1394(-)
MRDILPPADPKNFNELLLVMEFVDTDLDKLIRSTQYFTVVHIRFFLYQILMGLRYVHDSNIIHRDLKPANLLVNEDCTLKICDFGLARGTHFKSGDSDNSDDLPFLPSQQHQLLPGTPPTHKNAAKKRKRPIDLTGDASASVAATTTNSSSSSNVNNTTNGGVAPPPPLRRQLTKHVVTRWYRSPELILLVNKYDAAIDMWSVGCILAELLTMQKESVPRPSDRRALFPGSSCFPLSADHKTQFKDQMDQLNVIFDIIGTPHKSDIQVMPTEKIRKYLYSLPRKRKIVWPKRFPGADPLALDLLDKLLSFNPDKRPTAEEALNHPFLASVRNPEAERQLSQGKPVDMEFEDSDLSMASLRELVWKEIEYYNNSSSIGNGNDLSSVGSSSSSCTP